MPLLTLFLLKFTTGVTREAFLQRLTHEKSIEVVVASQPRFLVVRPEKTDAAQLASPSWDLMLLLRTPNGRLPDSLQASITQEYKVSVGVPSKLLSSYPERNKRLIKDSPNASLTGSLDNARVPESSQNLELSPELLKFMDDLVQENAGPTTMLNLLHFKEGGKPSYYKYGQVQLLRRGLIPSLSLTRPGLCQSQ